MNIKHFRSLLLLTLILVSSNTYSYFGVGNYVGSIGKYQKDNDGGTRYFGLNPAVFLNTRLNLPFGQLFLPEAGFIYHTGLEPEYYKYTIYLLYDLGWEFNPRTILRYGLGNFVTMVGGEGGTDVLNDGAGTEEFYRPDGQTTSYNTSLNVGLEHYFWSNSSLRFETHILSLLNSDARELSILTAYNVHW